MSEEKIQGYRYAGDIEVKFIKFIDQTGEITDIGPITKEVDIYQNLFEHYLQGELVINDAVAFLNTLKGDPENGVQGGFSGGEVVVICYKTRSKDLEFKTHFFGVYDITERERLDDKNEVYVLNLISAEAYQATPKKISRAFGGSKGNLVSNMAKSVINEFIYNKAIKDLHRNYRDVIGVRIEKQVNIDPTNGVQQFVIPNLSVDDTVDFFAKEADNDLHIPYFTFYENSDGFNFRDINTLVQQDVREEYTYVSTNVRDDEDDPELAVRDYQKIIAFQTIRQTNILGNVKGGLFRQRVINLDILKKDKSEVVYDYDQTQPKMNTLQKWKIPGQVEGDPVITLIQSRTGHESCTCRTFFAENHLPKRVNQFIARQKSYQRHIFNTLMEVTVPGNSEIVAGDVVRLNIPTATDLDKEDGKRDKYLSGKYLVTSVRHIFGGKTGETFTTVFECTKDTGIEI